MSEETNGTGGETAQTGLPGSQAETPAASAAQDYSKLNFSGHLGPLFKLALKNAILTLLTLGIYRFWAKTAVRRYFWGHTVIQGEPLEYTGRGTEMLLGFLLVVAILAPLSLAYNFVVTAVGPLTTTGQIIQGLYSVMILCLIYVAVFRIWRYRLSRTSWRGIRFALDGEAWRFMFVALAWTVLTAFTLGLAYPWMRKALWKYRIDRTRFGSAKFTFDKDTSALRLLIPWLLTLGFPLAFGTTMGFLAMTAGGTQQSLAQAQQLISSLGHWMFLGALAWVVVYTWYRLTEFRLVVGAIRIDGGAGLRSSVRLPVVIGISALFWATFMLAFAVLGVFFFSMVMAGAGAGGGNLFMVGGVITTIVMVMVILPMLYTLIMQYGMIRHIVNTLAVSNPKAFAAAIQTANTGPSRGEGLADVLDVGAF
ncbi:MAG: DUF898 family protein [Rhodospirillales bacterium]